MDSKSKKIIDELPDELVKELLAEIGDVNESTYRRGYQQCDHNATGGRFSKPIADWRFKFGPFRIAESPPNARCAYKSTVVERLRIEVNRDRWPLLTKLLDRVTSKARKTN